MKWDAVFHAAAVSDFTFGRIWSRTPGGKLSLIRSPKISTRDGPFLAEFVPALKIISQLRGWFPKAFLVGWKYELEGNRAQAIARAERQLADNKTDICVVNGRAYGPGFGLVTAGGKCRNLRNQENLFDALSQVLTSQTS
jgi:phosphopantothenoylcysteine decarboxylase/phosphopantothenate--cysteine ligase